MPPKGYSNITVRREVREELEKLRQEIGVRDFSDLLVLLVKIYREYTSVSSKIEGILTSISSKLDILLTSNTSIATSFSSKPTSDSSKEITSVTSKSDETKLNTSVVDTKKKGDACEWLNREKIITEGEITGKYPQDSRDRFFKKWKEVCKAVVIEGSKERTAVLPEIWEEFLRKISSVNNDEETEVKKVLDKDEYKLFKWLKEEGLLVFSVVEKKWMFIQ